MLDIKNFRLSKLNTPEYRHLYLLLYWIIYLVLFQLLEHYKAPHYNIIHCALDNIIPFNELFLMPYLFWFVYMCGMTVYGAFWDKDCFVYFMKLIIITTITELIVYFTYPTALNLRPIFFERDNLLTDIMKSIYAFDTSTNVCPSMHVSGSLCVLMASRRAVKLQGKAWRLFFIIAAASITISTVFVKQHSVIDVLWALILCLAAELAVRIHEAKNVGHNSPETVQG